jgi:deoxyguanosine kinase
LGPYNYIAIEGNIGAGKTSLVKKMAEDFSGRLILEQFSDNPFLPKFYKDPKKYAFPLEMSFLAERFQQLSDQLPHEELFSSFTISDYFVLKSLIFAQVNLEQDEYELYKRVFHLIYRQIPKPDLLVYLHRPTEVLLQNIQQRGRHYERDIEERYLNEIQESYFNYLKQEKELRVLILEVGSSDFLKSKSVYRAITNEMRQEYPAGITVSRLT